MGGVYLRQPSDSGIFVGPYISANSQVPLVFAKINLTDDSSVASHDEQFIKNLGTIKVHAHRGQELGPDYGVGTGHDQSKGTRVSSRTASFSEVHGKLTVLYYLAVC